MAVRLERLKVNRYRHLAEPADLRFGDGVVLVIGRNGTGKSNLLSLLTALLDLDFTSLERDPSGFDLELELAWDTLRLRLHAECGPPDTSGRPSGGRWRYRGEAVSADGSHHAPFDVQGGNGHHPSGPEPPALFDARFRAGLSWFLNGEEGQLATWLRELIGPKSLRAGVPHVHMDESLRLFDDLTRGEEDASPRIQLSDHATLGTALIQPSMVPVDLIDTIYFRPVERRGDDVSAEVPWLTEAARAAGFESISVRTALRREEPIKEDQIRRIYLPFTFYGRLRNGTRIAHPEFSFGQKRIVAFFWYLQCVRDAGSAVIADELVNGLHHDAVQIVIDGLAGLQSFLAGQDPLLFDFMEYTSAEDVRTRIVRCDWGASGWTWRNPTEDEAARFMSAYDIGFQPVNEILLTEGLW